MLNVLFIMEQHVGHRSYYENLKYYLGRSKRIQPKWVEVTYTQTESRFDWFRLFPQKIRGMLHGMSQARRYINKEDYDVAFFNTQVPATLSYPSCTKKPYVLSTDITPIQYDTMGSAYGHLPDRSGLLKWYKRKINTAVFQGAARILPWSNWTGSSLIKDYSVHPERIEVVPPGIDLNRWRPLNQNASQEAGGKVRILFVGGDFHRKGGDTLLNAFNSLPPGSAELLLVTRDPIEARPGITVYKDLKPNSEQLISLYQSSDMFVLPTQAEAFGIVFAEASAVALPVIATPIGGVVDIIVDGETGYLVPPDDERALTARLQKLIDDPLLRRNMGMNGRKRVETHFNAQTNVRRIEEILLNIVGESL